MDGIQFEYTTKADDDNARGRVLFDFKTSGMEDDENDRMFRFEGMASTFGNVDFDGDIIEPGAFTASLARLEARRAQTGRLMPVLFSHSTSAPVGVFTSLTQTEDGLFAKGELPLDDTFVAGRIVPQMRAGSIRAMSIGFQILERRFEGELRVIEKIELFEASLVVFGANPMALVTSIKNNKAPKELTIPKISRDDAEELTTRELEEMLAKGCMMSVQLSKKVASLLAADLRDAGEPQPAPRDVDAKDTGELSSLLGGMAKGLLSATRGNSSRDHRDHR